MVLKVAKVVGVAVAVCAFTTPLVKAQSCVSWSAEFAGNDLDDRAIASTWYDDGTGNALYIGGLFRNAGGNPASHIAKWNGSTWSALGSGIVHSGSAVSVNAILPFDDGTGSALYVGGLFTQAGSVSTNAAARWKNGAWQALPGISSGTIFSLAVFNDGSGPALYAAGDFRLGTNYVPACVLKWTGSAWVDTGIQEATGGFVSWAESLAVYDDGSGAKLYAGGGALVTTNGTAVGGVARYDGSQWYPVLGLDNTGSLAVHALCVGSLNGGSPALFAGGVFNKASGQTTNGAAAWNGSTWSPLGAGVGEIRAFKVYDDGFGPALYAGGSFSYGLQEVAKWDGSAWYYLGSGVNNTVYGLNTRTTPQGDTLLVFGDMTSAGGMSVAHMAEWNGGTWLSRGNGFGEPGSPAVWTLAEYDDGTGPAMYAGGPFNAAGPVTSQAIARWGYGSWSSMPPTGTSVVTAMLGHDDGSGPQLYAAGDRDCRRWNGSSWTAPGFVDGRIEDLAEFNDGSGNALYAVGSFVGINGVPASGCGSFDGTDWQGFSGFTPSELFAVALFDSGSGLELYAAGSFTSVGGNACSRIARWDGSSWQPLGAGLNGTVNSMTVHNDGSGNALYVCGQFSQAGGSSATKIARWNGSTWSAVGAGLNGNSANVVASLDLGAGARLYAGGDFSVSGEGRMLLMWDGSSWSAVGNGGTAGVCRALALYDEGSGPKLFAGGSVSFAGNQSVNGIVRLDGSNWVQPGGGLNGPVWSLCAFNDGTGTKLYAGGNFYFAFGVGTVEHVARWNGTAWSAVGSGLAPDGGDTFNGEVNSLKVCDFGSGPLLIAGGYFDRSGTKPLASMAQWDGTGWSGVSGAGVLKDNRVKSMVVDDHGAHSKLYFVGPFGRCGVDGCRGLARWNGAAWESVGPAGGGFDNTALAAAVYDPGSGPALYVAGSFLTVQGTSAVRIARWDGASWSAVGSGVTGGAIYDLLVHDDGSGVALYAGGNFTNAGGAPAAGIARWNGSTWAAVGSGVSSSGYVLALAEYDDSSGPALFAAGSFTSMGGTTASNIAKWDGSVWSAVGTGVSGGVVNALAVGGPPGAKRLFAGGTFTSAGGNQSLRIASWGPCPPRAADVFCGADFNKDHFVTGDDFDAFSAAFDIGDPSADVNRDGFVNGDDFDFFSQHFDAGC